ncbi:amino acid transporter-like protein [Saccharata proteae CBS 121410]|uniref:Amino acid transporter-like protein n=1 Tax=Saccharata proteae CBS 121410 TaxID=1314787 RepID=A0A9P4LY54_9PEZI|nr:amino acid transporter-like protein [Saccharata proteae CBS 121410]
MAKSPNEVEIAVKLPHDRDAEVLALYGKQQQFKRIFGFIPIVGLTCTLMITWEGQLITFEGGLENGGSAGLVYGYLFIWIGNMLQAVVMAELASMIPLSGGQYNWVAILSPASCSKFLSYLTGWMAVIGWQAVLASAGYLCGTMIQGIIAICKPDYRFERWQGTLLAYGVILLALFVNTLTKSLLPKIETAFLAIHVLGFAAVLTTLVVMAPHANTAAVFQEFNNGGNWGGDGLSVFVGLTQTMFAFAGIDAASHLAEEIVDAPRTIPRSMLASVMLNGILGWAMVIAVLFCIGNLEAALNTPTGYPIIEIFLQATGSVGGAVGLTLILVLAAIFSITGIVTTASRMMWAFAREKGLPFSSFLSRVHPRSSLPLNSILVTTTISLLLNLINIGSSVALNALSSVVIAAFYASFIISASVLLHKRMTTPAEDMNFGPFSLGRWGIPVIILTITYSAIGLFFSFWPPGVNPNPTSMNWSVAVFGGSLIFSMGFWAVWGRDVYKGPIIEVSVLEERGLQRQGIRCETRE